MSNMNGLCHSWMRRVEYTMSQAPVFSVWIKWHASPESLIGYFQLEWTKGWTSKTNWDESPCPFCHGGDSRSDLDKIRRSSDMRAHQESFKRKNVAVFVHLDIFRKTECIPYLWTYIFIFTCVSLLLLLFDRNQHQLFLALRIKKDLSFEFLFAFSSILSPHWFQYYLTLV